MIWITAHESKYILKYYNTLSIKPRNLVSPICCLRHLSDWSVYQSRNYYFRVSNTYLHDYVKQLDFSSIFQCTVPQLGQQIHFVPNNRIINFCWYGASNTLMIIIINIFFESTNVLRDFYVTCNCDFLSLRIHPSVIWSVCYGHSAFVKLLFTPMLQGTIGSFFVTPRIPSADVT